MGSSGAGKSTLSSLFGGFVLEAKLDEEIGMITIDHQNIKGSKEKKSKPPKIAKNWCESETKIPNEIIKMI